MLRVLIFLVLALAPSMSIAADARLLEAQRALTAFAQGHTVDAEAAVTAWEILAASGLMRGADTEQMLARLHRETGAHPPGSRAPQFDARIAVIEACGALADVERSLQVQNGEDADSGSRRPVRRAAAAVAAKLVVALKLTSRLPVSAERDRLRLRLETLAARARNYADLGRLPADLGPLVERSLASSLRDGLAYSFIVQTSVTERMLSGKTDSALIDRLRRWQVRARASLPEADPAPDVASLFVAQAAAEVGDRAAVREALGGTLRWLERVPPSLLGVGDTQEVALLAEEAKDPALLARARRLALTSAAQAGGTDLEAAFDLLPDEPDIAIATLGQVIARLDPEAPAASEVRRKLLSRLAQALAKRDRAGEAGTYEVLVEPETRTRLAAAGPADVPAMLQATYRLDKTSPDTEAHLRRAVALSVLGSGVAESTVVSARMELVRMLGEGGRSQEGRAFLLAERLELSRPDALTTSALRLFLEQAAEWLERMGFLSEARYFRDLHAFAPAEAAWRGLDQVLREAASVETVRNQFATAANFSLQEGRPIGPMSRLRERLNRVVPPIAERLRMGSKNDVALFAMPYARMLTALGEARLAGIARTSSDDGYAQFCTALALAGDQRFADRRSGCVEAAGTRADATEQSERTRLAALITELDVPAGPEDYCQVLITAAKRRFEPSERDRARAALWHLLEVADRAPADRLCTTDLDAGEPILALATSYTAPALPLAIDLFERAARGGVASHRRSRALASALIAAAGAGRSDEGLALFRRVLADPRFHDDAAGLPVANLVTDVRLDQTQRRTLLDILFPNDQAVLAALSAILPQQETTRQQEGIAGIELRDMAFAAVVAAWSRSERDGPATRLVEPLKALVQAAAERPENGETRALANTALAFALEFRDGRAAATPMYEAAKVALTAALKSGADPGGLLSLLRSATFRFGLDMQDEANRLADALALKAGRLPSLGSNLEQLDNWSPWQASRQCFESVSLSDQPSAFRPSRPDVACVGAVATIIDAALQTFASDLRARHARGDEAGAELERTLIARLVTEPFALLGQHLVARLPERAVAPLLGLAWSHRPRSDRDLASKLLARTSGVTPGPKGGAYERWVRESGALHRLLASGEQGSPVRLAAVRADEAWQSAAAAAGSEARRTPMPVDQIDLPRIQAALRPDEAMVSFLLPDLPVAAVLRKDRAALVHLTLDLDSVGRTIGSYRATLDPTGAARAVRVDLGHNLYAALLAPLETHLEGMPRLLLDLPQTLAPLPFHALVTRPPSEPAWTVDAPDVPAWAVLRWSMMVVSHPMLVAHSREVRRPERPLDVLVTGDPVLPDTADPGLDVRAVLATAGPVRARLVQTHFAKLPGASEEIRAIASVGADRSTVLQGAAFTASALKQAITRSRTHLVLATHAESAPGGEAFLVTTPQGGEDGGAVTATDIRLWPLDAELVLLSACRTGAAAGGSASFGSLAAGFQDAGARRVITTLWPILSDRAGWLTTAVMQDALRDGRADPLPIVAAAARRLAQGPAGAGARHPEVWAAFVLMGEP